MELLPLHKHKQFIEPVARILNEEWPRSMTARVHSLEKSSDNFPYCLVLLKDGKPIGHSRLCLVAGIPTACLIETVIIAVNERGLGYGKILMEMTENHAKKLNFNTCYLTTHNKQRFYGRVGYSELDPSEAVVSLGNNSHLINNKQFENFFNDISSKTDKSSTSVNKTSCKSQDTSETKSSCCTDTTAENSDVISPAAAPCITPVNSAPPGVPPPPPVPLTTVSKQRVKTDCCTRLREDGTVENATRTWMKKVLF